MFEHLFHLGVLKQPLKKEKSLLPTVKDIHTPSHHSTGSITSAENCLLTTDRDKS